MFASFNDVFKGKSLREKKVPDVTLKYLSNNLPKGVKYVSDEHGNLTITSSDGSAVTFGGFNVTVTDEMRSVLGKQCSAAQIAKYAYNTQKKIEMNLKEDGMIIVNGERMPVEKFAYNMFDNFSYINSKFYMIPPKFPEPFELELGCEKYKRKLTFQRVPYASLDKSKFQSVNGDPLRMEFIVCEEDYSVKMTLGFDLKKANTVKDIVERCGVNRNTFYYHFRDISDVVECALKREVDKAFEQLVEIDSVLECLEVLVNLIGENRKAMLHIYGSLQRENFTNALDKMCQYIVRQYAEHNFDPEILEKEEVKVLMHFYKCVMTGVMLDWMDHRMSYDLTEYAGKIRALYGNTFEKTLEKAAGAKPAQLKII